MASTILQQILALINTGSTVQQAIDQVVPGADPSYWQHLVKRHQAQVSQPQRKPRKRTTSKRSNGQPRKRFNYAAQVLSLGYAMAELTERVNSRSVHPTANDDTSILEVAQ